MPPLRVWAVFAIAGPRIADHSEVEALGSIGSSSPVLPRERPLGPRDADSKGRYAQADCPGFQKPSRNRHFKFMILNGGEDSFRSSAIRCYLYAGIHFGPAFTRTANPQPAEAS
jgi:hypothetical protein